MMHIIKVTVFSNDVLLIIFRHYLDASASFWFKLAHVCRSWRQIIFASPLGLRLRLHCTYGTPVLKNLDCWPPFPLVLNYGGFPTLHHPSPEDEDNILAALKHSIRVCSISLTVSSSLLNKLSTISETFSEIEELVLLSQDNVQLTLPSAFWWGHRLRTLHSTRIAIPSLPQLLFPSQDLVDLQLNEIPGVGYFTPEAFANALCGMTQLQTLSLHFLSFPPRRNYLSLPPLPGDRVVLPALTFFKYRGISKYLDNFVARIDTPHLGDIDITFFNQPTLDASQLGLFISRTEMPRSLRADILSSGDAISITFTSPLAHTLLRLQISCKQLDWQLSSISQICDHFSTFLFSVEDLGIKTTGRSSVPDDVNDEQWLKLIRAFDSLKDFRVAGELAADILRALRQAEEQKIVLPALRNLRVPEPMSMMNEPLRDSVASFAAQRQICSRPVQIHHLADSKFRYMRRPTIEEVTSARSWVEKQKRTAFNHSLEGVAGYPPVPDSEIQEYIRNLEHLNMRLSNTGRYIHVAFAALRKEDVVRRIFTMMAFTKFQLEESNKPNPRYILEPRTIRGMIQEADNIDKGLKTVLGLKFAAKSNAPVPQGPPEGPPQQDSALNQASVNHIPPQRSIPTPQQDFVPSVTAQSNLTQMSPHVSSDGFNRASVQIPGALPQPPPQAPHSSPQQTLQYSIPYSEVRFKALLSHFTNSSGLRLNDRDFVVDGRAVNPWALHRAVFARNGFDSVTANNEWPAVGAALGFPPFSAGNLTHQPRCAPAIAHRLQQLYNDSLRPFEQAYIKKVLAQLRRSQAAQPSQQQALLASILRDSSAMTPEAMSILPRISHTSGADLEAHPVPSHIVGFVEQHRDHLQLERPAQDQNGFPAALTFTKNLPLDNRALIDQDPFENTARAPQLSPDHIQLQVFRALAQAQGKPNTLQPTQLFDNGLGLISRPSTPQSISTIVLSSMGTQISSPSSNSGARSQSGSMSVPMSAPLTQGGTNGVTSGSILTQSAGAVPIRRPTTEEIATARKILGEQKRVAFNRSFEGFGRDSVPDSEIQDYIRDLKRLDMMLGNVERGIVVFVVQKEEDVVRRFFAIMAITKFQLEESKKPNPRYVLGLHSIRAKTQEVVRMYMRLKAILASVLAHSSTPVPHRKEHPGAAMSPPTPRPVPTVFTPTLQTVTPPFRIMSTIANGLEKASSTPAITSILASSTHVNTKGGVKRSREDEVDGATQGAASAPSQKRVKYDWEGPPNEEERKRDGQAENVKTEQVLAIFETSESAEAALNALNEILRVYPSAPAIDDGAMASSMDIRDLPPTSPRSLQLENDAFEDFFDFSAFSDTPTQDLVTGSSTNPSQVHV